MALPKVESKKLHKQPARDSRDVDRIELPPLESGDCLTRDEFERRFDAMPNLKKAELIEGVVYVRPTASANTSSGEHSMASLIGFDCAAKSTSALGLTTKA